MSAHITSEDQSARGALGDWVPGVGWKKLSDWTERDLLARLLYERDIIIKKREENPQ